MATGLAPALQALRSQPSERLATLPTPLEFGPKLPGGAQLLVKRDDLTGLGMGGNKARKLEFICAAASSSGANALVTVGASQSNHARMTAAAGAVLGIQSHLVLGGSEGDAPEGNQLLSQLFGAQLHFAETNDWEELSGALSNVVDGLSAAGQDPYRIPIGGSTPLGAIGFVAAWMELMEQCERDDIVPTAIVHASSTGGTHAGLLAGSSIWEQSGRLSPQVLAVDVAKQPGNLAADTLKLARNALNELGLADVAIDSNQLLLVDGWTGDGYAIPSQTGDDAALWAGRNGAWILDRVYTSKAFAFLLDAAGQGRFDDQDVVVFWHTGGIPAIFAKEGVNINHSTPERGVYTWT